MPENRLKSGFWTVSAYYEPRCRAFLRRGFVHFMAIRAVCVIVIVKRLEESLNHSGNR